jgi:hypothetical protein
MRRFRKIRCDEKFPVCNRCLSTGRVCDGYGIWGGGGNSYLDRKAAAPACALSLSKPVSATPHITLEEQYYMEWFHRRSIDKLPGVLQSAFWGPLVLQASMQESAVFHALLALGAAHKRDVLDVNTRTRRYYILDEQEKFTLRQYSKAISRLQPHFSSQNKESLRVALIACLIFVSLEFLRGHYKTGSIHLANGLKLVNNLSSGLLPSSDIVDYSIIEMLVRLQLQVHMFGQDIEHTCSFPKVQVLKLSASKFDSLAQARQHLDSLLRDICHLTNLRLEAATHQGELPSSQLLEAQSDIRARLSAWLITLTESADDLRVHTNIIARFSYRFLLIYHTMAGIMIETCLETIRESIYENFTCNFAFLLAQIVDMRKGLLLASKPGVTHDLGASPFGSVIDIGWIPAIYFMAIKCRVHRIRVHAIRLLNSEFHKEGIWDSQLAACIAREVMEIEERDFYQKFHIDDDFSLNESCGAGNLTLPSLPEQYLVKEVKIVFFDDPAENIKLKCKRHGSTGNWELITKEISMPLHS